MSILLLLAVFISASFAQKVDLLKNIGGSGVDEVSGITADGSGNFVVTGSFENKCTFGDFPLISSGGQDAFIVKFNGNGEAVWAQKAGGPHWNNDRGLKVAVDAAGNCLAGGIFYGTANFGAVSMKGGDEGNTFIASYNINGQVQWVKKVSGNGFVKFQDLVVDNEGNVYVTGFFTTEARLEDKVLQIKGDGLFLAKYTASGELLWAVAQDGIACCSKISLGVDGLKNIFIAGTFGEGLKIGNATLSCYTNAQKSASHDIFVARFSPEGQPVWAKKLGGFRRDEVNALKVDGRGDLYLAGSFVDSLQVGLSWVKGHIPRFGDPSDIFLLKMSGNGDFLWAKAEGGFQNDVAQALALDAQDNIYLSGKIQHTVYFGDTVLNNNGLTGDDFFVARFSPNGCFQWVKRSVCNFDDEGTCLAVDKSGKVYCGGDFRLSLSLEDKITASNTSSDDGFISRINDTRGFTASSANPGASDFAVYPNPVFHDFYVDLTPSHKSLNPDDQVVITTLDGKELLRKKVDHDGKPTLISSAGLNNGVYMVTVEGVSGKSASQRIDVVKQ